MFQIEGQEKPASITTFKTYIDEDGDFVVAANGVALIYFDVMRGKLERFYISRTDRAKIPSIAVADDRVAVADLE